MNTELADVYTRITNQIVEAIEQGAADWRMPWHSTGKASFAPLNAATQKPYRGVNVLGLWAAAKKHGYPSGYWATYKQWQEMGAQVRKGEKSSLVVFWKFADVESEDEDSPTADEASRRLVLARGYSVFNAAQVDGFVPPEVAERPVADRIECAEEFFASLGATIQHGGNRAYYQPSTDSIHMPVFEAFIDPVSYYGTLAHEATHWTGVPPRLNRDLSGRFGNEAYAAEELVAELGAAFLCADLSLSNEPRPDHAAYVSSWLTVLRRDKRAIFTAAAKAQAAADWMRARCVRKVDAA
jgi:antirestriction protein ArdC